MTSTHVNIVTLFQFLIQVKKLIVTKKGKNKGKRMKQVAK